MIAQFDNKAISSFLLWLDYVLMTKGTAFANVGTIFYPVTTRINGYVAYGAPFKPFVADSSISGAHVITGIFLNGIPVSKGQSGFVDINYQQGQLYFSSPLPKNTVVSGNYAVKDFELSITDEADEKILFENKYDIRPKTYQVQTGLVTESLTIPAIFIKNDGGNNDLFTLDGLEDSQINIRAVVLGDSQFLMDAVGSLFKDRARSRVPLLDIVDMPFNNLGGYRSGIAYNYNTFSTGRMQGNNSLFVRNVSFSKFTARNALASELKDLNASIYFGFIDFDLSMIRITRT